MGDFPFRSIQLLRLHLRGEGVHPMRTYENRGKGASYQCECSHILFLIEHLVYELLIIITRLYVRE